MKKLLDLSYSNIDPDIRKVNIFLPEEDTRNNACIFFIHGGGWTGGSRQQWHSVMEHFCNLGYVCSSCSYRLLPDYCFPAQIDDVRLAMSFVKERTGEYGFDPERIAVWGSSAGGHLCGMLATIDDDDELGVTPELTIRQTRPAAAVYLCTVFSLHKNGYHQVKFAGKSEEEAPELYCQASPIDRVSAATPPCLMVVGDQDETTTVAMHEAMKEAMAKYGVAAQLEILPEVTHGYGYGVVSDAQKQTLTLAEQFLQKTLLA